jgi:hypothetical protein
VGRRDGRDSTVAQRWGTNTTATSIFIDQDTNGTIRGTYLETLFDRDKGNSEAQIAIGDSGGGLFEMSPQGVWKLAGIADLAPTGHVYYDNDPATTGDQPDAAYYLRMETYRDQILAATNVPEPALTVLLLFGGGILAGRPARRRGRLGRAAPAWNGPIRAFSARTGGFRGSSQNVRRSLSANKVLVARGNSDKNFNRWLDFPQFYVNFPSWLLRFSGHSPE